MTTELLARMKELQKRRASVSRALVQAHCAEHVALSVLERPILCQACRLDIEGRLRLTVELTAWFTAWQADAMRVFQDVVRQREILASTYTSREIDEMFGKL